MNSSLEASRTIKYISEQGARLELNMQATLQLQKWISQQQLLTAVEWIFDQGQELFPQHFAATERAAWYFVKLLSAVEIKSLFVLEVVGWACLSLSADEVGVSLPLEAFVDCNVSAIQVSKQYIVKRAGKPPSTVASACAEVLKTLGQPEDLLQSLSTFMRKRYLGVDGFSADVAAAAFAALLWTYDHLQLSQAKEEFLAKYQADFSDVLERACALLIELT